MNKVMEKLAAIVPILGLCSQTSAAPIQSWIRPLPTTYLGVESIIVDPAGSILLASSTLGDAHVAKISPAGELLWQLQVGGSGNDQGNAITADSAGNTYLAGYFQTGGIGPPDHGGYGYVAKFNGMGDTQWVKPIATKGPGASAQAILTDDRGGLYVAGSFQYGTFLERYDFDGSLQWTRTFAEAPIRIVDALVSDDDGNLILSGNAGPWRSPPFGCYVLKLDGAGNEIWQRQFDTGRLEMSVGLSNDRAGNIYISGGTSEAGGADAFIAKWNPQGELVWSTQLGLLKPEWVTIRAAVNGLVFAGSDWSPTGGDEHSAIIGQIDEAGSLLWTRNLSEIDSIAGLAMSGSSAFVAGRKFNPSSGRSEAYLLRINNIPEPSSILLYGSASLAVVVIHSRRRL